MRTDPQSLLLVIGGAGFVLVLVLKWLIAPQRRDAAYQQARRRMLSAKRRASDRTLPALERAASFREAARIALEELQRPSLAAAFARRADRFAPENPENAGLLALALRRGARYSALERLLWRRLADEAEAEGPGQEQALEELVSLYDGPLQRPETARALRRLRPASVHGA